MMLVVVKSKEVLIPRRKSGGRCMVGLDGVELFMVRVPGRIGDAALVHEDDAPHPRASRDEQRPFRLT